MKTSKKIAAIILLTSCFSAFAQEQTLKPIKRVSVNDFYVLPGFMMQGISGGTVADFKKLAPQSTLLTNNFSDFNQSGGFGFSGNASLSMMLGIQFSNKEKTSYKKSPLLRLGLSYFSGAGFSANLYKTTTKPYDTLSSQQTGQTVYKDSVINRNYYMNYTSQQVRLDASLIFRTNPEARWSLFAGVGITAGISINARTDISYYADSRTQERNSGNSSSNSYYNNSSGNYKSESFVNTTNFGASVYVPMGLDFRLGKKNEFWKRMHLFYEARPGVNALIIPELTTLLNGSIQQGIGLRVSWN